MRIDEILQQLNNIKCKNKMNIDDIIQYLNQSLKYAMKVANELNEDENSIALGYAASYGALKGLICFLIERLEKENVKEEN